MGMNKYDLSDAILKRRTFSIFDDFPVYVSTDLWTSTASGASAAGADGEGGILQLVGTTSANDYAYVKTTQKCFKIVNNNPLYCEAFIQFSEADTNKANVMFGFSSSVVAGMIANSTGEPQSTFDGAVIYKVNGATVWNTKSSQSTTSPGKSISTTTAGGTAYQRLLIVIEPVSSTVAEITYYVNGIQLQVSGARNPIKDNLTYTGITNMNFFVGLKQTSTSTAETINVDYMAAGQLRALFT
jgi:hypothetical protein